MFAKNNENSKNNNNSYINYYRYDIIIFFALVHLSCGKINYIKSQPDLQRGNIIINNIGEKLSPVMMVSIYCYLRLVDTFLSTIYYNELLYLTRAETKTRYSYVDRLSISSSICMAM